MSASDNDLSPVGRNGCRDFNSLTLYTVDLPIPAVVSESAITRDKSRGCFNRVVRSWTWSDFVDRQINKEPDNLCPQPRAMTAYGLPVRCQPIGGTGADAVPVVGYLTANAEPGTRVLFRRSVRYLCCLIRVDMIYLRLSTIEEVSNRHQDLAYTLSQMGET